MYHELLTQQSEIHLSPWTFPLLNSCLRLLVVSILQHIGMKKLYDLEKGNVHDVPSPSPDLSVVNPETLSVPGKFATWNSKIESFAGLEARGIERVLPSERQKASTSAYLQMALLWFSTNVTANNLTLGLLGPLVYELSFLDSALCAVFGSFVGSIGASYMSIWGPQSGNRTMVGFLIELTQ